MFARYIAVAVATAFLASAAVPVRASMVCRYTGRSVDPCECFTARAQQDSSFEDLGCCELRVNLRASFSGLATSQDEHGPLPVLLVAGLPSFLPSAPSVLEPSVVLRQRRCGSPGEQLYLRFRQLLS